jgi:hypothetical protein
MLSTLTPGISQLSAKELEQRARLFTLLTPEENPFRDALMLDPACYKKEALAIASFVMTLCNHESHGKLETIIHTDLPHVAERAYFS